MLSWLRDISIYVLSTSKSLFQYSAIYPSFRLSFLLTFFIKNVWFSGIYDHILPAPARCQISCSSRYFKFLLYQVCCSGIFSELPCAPLCTTFIRFDDKQKARLKTEESASLHSVSWHLHDGTDSSLIPITELWIICSCFLIISCTSCAVAASATPCLSSVTRYLARWWCGIKDEALEYAQCRRVQLHIFTEIRYIYWNVGRKNLKVKSKLGQESICYLLKYQIEFSKHYIWPEIPKHDFCVKYYIRLLWTKLFK